MLHWYAEVTMNLTRKLNDLCNQSGIAWLTFYRSDIRVTVVCKTEMSLQYNDLYNPYSKSNVGRVPFCQIHPAGATLVWGDEFFLGISKFGWSSQSAMLNSCIFYVSGPRWLPMQNFIVESSIFNV